LEEFEEKAHMLKTKGEKQGVQSKRKILNIIKTDSKLPRYKICSWKMRNKKSKKRKFHKVWRNKKSKLR